MSPQTNRSITPICGRGPLSLSKTEANTQNEKPDEYNTVHAARSYALRARSAGIGAALSVCCCHKVDRIRNCRRPLDERNRQKQRMQDITAINPCDSQRSRSSRNGRERERVDSPTVHCIRCLKFGT